MTKKKSVEKSNPECRRSLTDRSELQKFVLHLLQGTMIGIGAVLPGISGGVLSVVFGIYEPIMAFLSNPREALSQYGRLLLPVLLGAAGGFLLSARAIGFFLTRYEVLSVCLFVGLIVGMLPSMFREAGEKGRSRWDLYTLAGGVFYGADPFEFPAPDQRFDSAGAFGKFVLRLLRGAQHHCARDEFFCAFDAARALYAVYGRRRSSVPACGCSGGTERRRDDGASGKTDHAAFGTALLGGVSWDHRDCFSGDAGDCAVFCVWKSGNVGSEPDLPGSGRRDCAAVFHAGGNVTGDAMGRQPVFFCIGSAACGAC